MMQRNCIRVTPCFSNVDGFTCIEPGSEHGIEEEDVLAVGVRRQPAIIANAAQRFLFSIQANMTDAGLGHELENGFAHPETGAPNWDKRDRFSKARSLAIR
jgi:hypothetical protein